MAESMKTKESTVQGAQTKETKTSRTQIAEIGKSELLKRLFEGTGYTNSEMQKLSERASESLSNSELLLEGIDFDLVYTPIKHLGYKTALLAMGPLYANCFAPKSLAYTLGLSARFVAEDIVEFWTGVVAAAKEHGVENLSLELKASVNGLAVGVTAQGVQKNTVVKSLPAPAVNDLICITGNVGAAYMGLHVLEREKAAFNKIPADKIAEYVQPDLSKYKYLLSQYLSPEINPKTIQQFKEAKLYPSAGYFITRGLAHAVKTVCGQKNFGARIFLDKIPIASQTFEMAKEINIDAITAALNGGEDYKFLFVIPIAQFEKFHKEFPNVDIIGHLTAPEHGCALITPEGAVIELKSL